MQDMNHRFFIGIDFYVRDIYVIRLLLDFLPLSMFSSCHLSLFFLLFFFLTFQSLFFIISNPIICQTRHSYLCSTSFCMHIAPVRGDQTILKFCGIFLEAICSMAIQNYNQTFETRVI